MAFNGRAVIYCRISDDREGAGVGVERQEKDCRALAARLSLEVVDVKIDNDIGASNRTGNKHRPRYQEMLAAVRAGLVDTIIAYSNSRLTRRPLEWIELINLAESGALQIKTVVSGSHDLTTAEGRALAITVAAWDAAEADRISERIKAANRHKALKGRPGIQHRRPFGFEKDAITHNPEEAALIRAAVKDILMGASITSIRRKWEKQGVLTTDGSSKWGWTPVHRVLFSWRTVGIRELNGEPVTDENGEFVKGVWEPIISLEDREAALEMLKKRTRKGERQGKWLLQGLLRCGRCGKPLYGALMKPPRTNSYTCTANGSTHLGIAAERLENYLRRVVFRYLLEKTIRVDNEASGVQKQTWPDEHKLESVARKIDELMEAYNTDRLSGSIVFPQVERLDQERRQLQKERSVFYSEQRDKPTLIETREEAWARYKKMHEQSFEDTQLALRQEINSVVIGPGTRGHAGKSYEVFKKRVTIHWNEPHYEFDGMTAEELADTPLRKLGVGEQEWGAPLSEEEQARLDALENLGRTEE